MIIHVTEQQKVSGDEATNVETGSSKRRYYLLGVDAPIDDIGVFPVVPLNYQLLSLGEA